MSNNEIGWKFPSTGHGAEGGFNPEGIAIFDGAPFESVAREVIQNSLDASLDEHLSSDCPVKVSFQYEEVPLQNFPFPSELLSIMKKCREASEGDDDSKRFFDEAQNVLSGNSIGCLRISDSNTTGMRDGKKGENIKLGQWWRLVKRVGQSGTSSISGGSFGIGKNAPFTVSALRTVFYSTKYTDDLGVIHQYAQGKSILISHDIGDGDTSQPIGFYGIKERLERLENDQIPSFLRRDDAGTTVLIAGLKDANDWQNKTIAAVLSNCFHAIHEGWLKVSVSDTSNKKDIVINKDNLLKMFSDRSISKNEDVRLASDYYRAMRGREPIEEDVPELGKCKLWVLVEEKLPRRVSILRRGMLITDSMKGIGSQAWRSYSDFVAVFLCDNDKGNELLRNMETPAHDRFDVERLKEESEKRRGEKALKNLRKWIKEKIQEVAGNRSNEVTSLDRMSDFFGYPEEGLAGDKKEKDFDGGSDIEGPDTAPVRVRPQKGERLDDNTPYDDDDDDEFDDPDVPPKPTPPTPPRPPVQRNLIPVVAVRILPEDDDGLRKRVMFTPTQSGKVVLHLNIVGDSYVEREEVSIKSVQGSDATISGGQVTLNVTANDRVTLYVTLSEPAKNDALQLLIEGLGNKS